MATQIQLRRDTAANWVTNNPILAEGETGIETDGLGTDTVLKKIGNGIDNWLTLPYDSSGGGGTGDMTKAVYDPTNIEANAFDRSNHTGEQPISSITDLQTELDSKDTSNVFSSNNITFFNVNGDYFGSFGTPRTGSLTVDNTSAVTGAVSAVYYQNPTLDIDITPIFTTGTFNTTEVNKLYIERDQDDNYTLNIVSASEGPSNQYTFEASYTNETYGVMTGVTRLDSNEYIEIKTTFKELTNQRPFFGNTTLVSDFAGTGGDATSIFLSQQSQVGNVDVTISPALTLNTPVIIRVTNVNDLSMTLTVDGNDYTGLSLNQLGTFNQMFMRGDTPGVIEGYHHFGEVEYIDFNGDLMTFTNTTANHQTQSGLITMTLFSGTGADISTLFTEI